jgi:hypothetical protein
VLEEMADTGGARNLWSRGLPSYRQYETEDAISRYEAPVFVPQTPSVVNRRRHSISGVNLTDASKQRTLQPAARHATFSKVSKVKDRIAVSFRTYALNMFLDMTIASRPPLKLSLRSCVPATYTVMLKLRVHPSLVPLILKT